MATPSGPSNPGVVSDALKRLAGWWLVFAVLLAVVSGVAAHQLGVLLFKLAQLAMFVGIEHCRPGLRLRARGTIQSRGRRDAVLCNSTFKIQNVESSES